MGGEDIIQINLINWLQFHHPEVYEHTLHIANQRSCSQQQGRLLKRMGVKKGVADLFIALPVNGKHGLWLEIKSHGGKPSQEQKVFIARMIRQGYEGSIVYGLEEAKEAILQYLGETA